ncbi:MAG TPA: hypothetical protein VMB18_13500 [Terriglobales bacterium]|nr:hypothetical protein [Terriglobales bacterium]
MTSRSPTLEGFRTILRRPSFGFAEISWRWSFSAAAGLLITFSFFEYLSTLPVSRLDVLLLKSRQPALVGQAIAHIFRGSALRVVRTSIVLTLCLAVLWIVIAALGRAATVKSLSAHFRSQLQPDCRLKNFRLRSLFGLNVLRVAAVLAASVGGLAALMLGSAVSPRAEAAPGLSFLIVLSVVLLVWLAWSVVNWFLSLASVFAVVAGENTFGSLTSAVNLCRDRTGSVFAAGTWFGLAHVVAFFVATSAVAFPLGFAAVLPPAVVMGGVLIVTLAYFAVADFLYMGRLAAYVAIIALPMPQSVECNSPESMAPQMLQATASSVDPEELILSDIPLAGEAKIGGNQA